MLEGDRNLIQVKVEKQRRNNYILLTGAIFFILSSCTVSDKKTDKVGYLYREGASELIYFSESTDSFIIHFFIEKNTYVHEISRRTNDTVFFETEHHIQSEPSFLVYERGRVKNKTVIVFPEFKKYYVCEVIRNDMIDYYDSTALSYY